MPDPRLTDAKLLRIGKLARALIDTSEVLQDASTSPLKREGKRLIKEILDQPPKATYFWSFGMDHGTFEQGEFKDAISKIDAWFDQHQEQALNWIESEPPPGSVATIINDQGQLLVLVRMCDE